MALHAVEHRRPAPVAAPTPTPPPVPQEQRAAPQSRLLPDGTPNWNAFCQYLKGEGRGLVNDPQLVSGCTCLGLRGTTLVIEVDTAYQLNSLQKAAAVFSDALSRFAGKQLQVSPVPSGRLKAASQAKEAVRSQQPSPALQPQRTAPRPVRQTVSTQQHFEPQAPPHPDLAACMQVLKARVISVKHLS